MLRDVGLDVVRDVARNLARDFAFELLIIRACRASKPFVAYVKRLVSAGITTRHLSLLTVLSSCVISAQFLFKAYT